MNTKQIHRGLKLMAAVVDRSPREWGTCELMHTFSKVIDFLEADDLARHAGGTPEDIERTRDLILAADEIWPHLHGVGTDEVPSAPR
jgi:hypothetical protein